MFPGLKTIFHLNEAWEFFINSMKQGAKPEKYRPGLYQFSHHYIILDREIKKREHATKSLSKPEKRGGNRKPRIITYIPDYKPQLFSSSSPSVAYKPVRLLLGFFFLILRSEIRHFHHSKLNAFILPMIWCLSHRNVEPQYDHTCVQCCLIQKLLRNLYPSSSIVENEVYITISNHNNQPNIREKDADLLCNRSSHQRDFNHPPLYCESMVCIVLIVHIFLPSIM